MRVEEFGYPGTRMGEGQDMTTREVRGLLPVQHKSVSLGILELIANHECFQGLLPIIEAFTGG